MKKTISIYASYALAGVIALSSGLLIGQLLFMNGVSRPLSFVGGLATIMIFALPFIAARLSEVKSRGFYEERARRE